MNPEANFMKIMMLWIGISLAISMGVNFVMFTFLGDAAFPWNLVVIIGVFLLLARWMARKQISMLKGGLGFDATKLSYVCSSCSAIYKGSECPRCGRRGGSVSFGK